MFLWHYPHGYPHWALPSKFGLSGARTFLRFTLGVNPQPPAPTLSLLSILTAVGYLLGQITVIIWVARRGSVLFAKADFWQ